MVYIKENKYLKKICGLKFKGTLHLMIQIDINQKLFFMQ